MVGSVGRTGTSIALFGRRGTRLHTMCNRSLIDIRSSVYYARFGRAATKIV